jgi:predicted secreted protein
MSEITRNIMEKVKGGVVKKIPKWRFIFKRTFIWTSLVVAVGLGAFSVSMVIFQIANLERDLIPRIAPDVGLGLFRLVPYFWMFVAVALFIFVYFDFKNTRKGHRYGGGIIILVSLLIALILGIGIFFLKTPERADKFFLKVPFYQEMHMKKEMMWNVPGRGVLSGIIIEIKDDKAFVLEDMVKHIWDIDIKGATIGKGPAKKDLEVGDWIKAIGIVSSPGEFKADEIRPFRTPRP